MRELDRLEEQKNMGREVLRDRIEREDGEASEEGMDVEESEEVENLPGEDSDAKVDADVIMNLGTLERLSFCVED